MIDSFLAGASDLALRPKRLLGVVETSVRVRGEIALAEQRRATLTELAETLSAGGQSATVTARERNGVEWTIIISSLTENASR